MRRKRKSIDIVHLDIHHVRLGFEHLSKEKLWTVAELLMIVVANLLRQRYENPTAFLVVAAVYRIHNVGEGLQLDRLSGAMTERALTKLALFGNASRKHHVTNTFGTDKCHTL